ncbi:HK97 gp10 family phage protein [Agrococcus casei]|uniref:Phage protein, HK97 gp10 family n=1 Tax=Agrococcus casei LMG 22410 TaxID=1255656 RepID=A0A1R4GFB8_9MICO|nr:HK97 gp10 family phage protein [Agrococcus casei]SJM66823.1 hypothetical protein CZ674_11495 [Agrococcus casei LMG 22410]
MVEAADHTYTGGPVKVTVKGLGRLNRALARAGVDAQNMRDLMHEIGMIAVRDAQGRVPVDSGRLRESIRSGRGKTKAVVRAGGARIPYAGVIHYGTPDNAYQPSPFLLTAIQAQRGAILNRFNQGVGDILAGAELK